MVDLSLLYVVLEGAGAAALAAFVGYVKSQEPFDYEKAGITVGIGAVLGGVAGFYGISVIDAENLLVSLGLFSAVVYFVDAGVKALVRFVKSKLAKPDA